MVVQDECVLEKPKDKEDALRMLRQLSGKTHYAITGVQIIYKKKDGTVEKRQFYERTNVKFCEIDTETMNACKFFWNNKSTLWHQCNIQLLRR